jgi:hypothetical protein
MSHALRQRLIALYAELAAMTEHECANNCDHPHSCCDEKYCSFAIAFARENWGAELTPTWHAALPLMGPDGCIAAPHLRPICTAHTCAISEFGCKQGDEAWTARYFAIRDEIETIETRLFPRLFV